MNILYISYWSALDGLSSASVHPNLSILINESNDIQIDYISIERNKHTSPVQLAPRIIHHPVYIKHSQGLRRLIEERKAVCMVIKQIFGRNKIDLVIARGAPTSWFANWTFKRYNTPFLVESFEPHGRYMVETGSWNRAGLKYFLETRIEKKAIRYARRLHVLTEAFKDELVRTDNRLESRVDVVPCFTDKDRFKFNKKARVELRKKYGWQNRIIGIYLGKKGGIYFDNYAIECITRSFDYFGERFAILILTPQDEKEWKKSLIKQGIPTESIEISTVPHEKVPAYLSASDYAWSFHKNTPGKLAISPIKHAEYWASGLPILMPPRLGDDSSLVERSNLGFVFNNLDDLDNIFPQLEVLIRQEDHRNEIAQIGNRLRDRQKQVEAYRKLLTDLG